jgi:hypothetical protein
MKKIAFLGISILMLFLIQCGDNPFALKENETATYIGDVISITSSNYYASADMSFIYVKITNFKNDVPLQMKGKVEIKIGDKVYAIRDKRVSGEIKDMRVLRQ